ncbi:hypothetical protein [uncultured Roseobacter sp.]|uniref:hypothetical protein n=1 Tax=uncultured Roseobacter sp. TaxID=114847 RepID=UPI00261A942C|nr:hypothetical protein [uncultured Roseobacter sp.]
MAKQISKEFSSQANKVSWNLGIASIYLYFAVGLSDHIFKNGDYNPLTNVVVALCLLGTCSRYSKVVKSFREMEVQYKVNHQESPEKYGTHPDAMDHRPE